MISSFVVVVGADLFRRRTDEKTERTMNSVVIRRLAGKSTRS